MNGLFDCAGGDGFIYRLNPSVKILLAFAAGMAAFARSEEHTSELQSRC